MKSRLIAVAIHRSVICGNDRFAPPDHGLEQLSRQIAVTEAAMPILGGTHDLAELPPAL
jgi:hypothetical protein